MVNHDTDLYNLTIQSDDTTSTIHTTSNHLFWDQTTHTWTPANKLHHGDHLQTPNSSVATVVGGASPAVTSGAMWDLTINADHDFYVAVAAPVLVHNCDDPLQEFAEANRTSESRFASEYTSPSGQTYYDVNADRGIPEDDPLGDIEGHHGGCAEIGCLRQATEAEGPDAANGGSMRTIFNRPPNTPIPSGPPVGQGAPAAPCPACQSVLGARGIRW